MGIMMRRACPARIITRMWKPLFLPLHAHVSLGLINLALCSLSVFFSSSVSCSNFSRRQCSHEPEPVHAVPCRSVARDRSIASSSQPVIDGQSLIWLQIAGAKSDRRRACGSPALPCRERATRTLLTHVPCWGVSDVWTLEEWSRVCMRSMTRYMGSECRSNAWFSISAVLSLLKRRLIERVA